MSRQDPTPEEVNKVLGMTMGAALILIVLLLTGVLHLPETGRGAVESSPPGDVLSP